MKWRTKCWWPDGTNIYRNPSTEFHATKEDAEERVEIIKNLGLDKRGITFPTRVEIKRV